MSLIFKYYYKLIIVVIICYYYYYYWLSPIIYHDSDSDYTKYENNYMQIGKSCLPDYLYFIPGMNICLPNFWRKSSFKFNGDQDKLIALFSTLGGICLLYSVLNIS